MTTALARKKLLAFSAFLAEEERSTATLSKYSHDVNTFLAFADDGEITKSTVLAYKEYLGEHYAVSSANSMLAALNSFFRFLGNASLCVKQFKLQRQAFCPEEKELSKEEYRRLVAAAEAQGNEALSLIIQSICATGIRVSELRFITAEAVRSGEASVHCKGKTRRIFIVSALRKRLSAYAKDQGIVAGPIFLSHTGKPLDRSRIWRNMKCLCRAANVSPTKVFPHNLRHLFARIFYGIEKDIVKLADVLGHTSINTTRIYTVTTGEEHRRCMETMRLIL